MESIFLAQMRSLFISNRLKILVNMRRIWFHWQFRKRVIMRIWRLSFVRRNWLFRSITLTSIISRLTLLLTRFRICLIMGSFILWMKIIENTIISCKMRSKLSSISSISSSIQSMRNKCTWRKYMNWIMWTLK